MAVHQEQKTLEYVCKPLTLGLLIGCALALDPADEAVRAWFVAALVLSLAGDVFLMLPQDLFVFGLARSCSATSPTSSGCTSMVSTALASSSGSWS